jgi:hypothetical protein
VRHHNAREIDVAGLEDRFHVHLLEQDDPQLAPPGAPAITATSAGDSRSRAPRRW